MNTGKVIDVEFFSKSWKSCSEHPTLKDTNKEEYERWKLKHNCSLNYEGFSILLYHLLTHVRMAKIVINFTPIVKDFSPKLRTKMNFSEKTDKYTTRKSKCYQMVLFLNEVICPYVLTIFCVDMSNIFV